jgi:hypothetical protein
MLKSFLHIPLACLFFSYLSLEVNVSKNKITKFDFIFESIDDADDDNVNELVLLIFKQLQVLLSNNPILIADLYI